MASDSASGPAGSPAPGVGAHRRVLEGITGAPATDGNRVTVLRNGVEIFDAMLDAVHSAQRSIEFMTYIYWRGEIADRFAEALAARARAGVRVRVVLDAFGCRPMDGALVALLQRAGAQVVVFRPFTDWKAWTWNLRTHRRVLVCDQAVAFTGGVGIAEEWEGDAEHHGRWRDTHFKVEGPAVDGIRAAFSADWLEVDRPVPWDEERFEERSPVGRSAVQVIRSCSQPGWNDAALTTAALLASAEARVRITTAYLRPPQYFVDLLGRVVRRGVAVDLLVPGEHTHPSLYRWAAEYHYGQLLERGVRLWVYQPTMHHGKVLTVDGVTSMVGTANFDARSFAMNEQVTLVVHDPEVTALLDAHFDEDRRRSEALELDAWSRRGLGQRLREVAAHNGTFALRGAGAARRDEAAPHPIAHLRRRAGRAR